MRWQSSGKIFCALVDVDSDPDDCEMGRLFLSAHFHEHAGSFFSIDINIVRRFDFCNEPKFFRNGLRNGLDCPSSEAWRFTQRNFWSQQDREPKSFVGRGLPAVVPLSTPCRLSFGKNDQTLRRA